MTVNEAIFEILEAEADDKYYLPNENGWAELPAFIICSGAYAKLGSSSYTVYMGRGLMDWTFRTHKAAQEHVIQAIKTSKKAIEQVKHVNFHDRKTEVISIWM